MFKRLLVTILLIFAIASMPSYAQNNGLDREAIRYAIGAFDPSITPEERARQIKYLVDRVLAPENVKKVVDVYSNQYDSEDDKRRAVQKQIASIHPVSFITMKDGTTYWTSSKRGQRVDCSYLFGLLGEVDGEAVEMSMNEMVKNLSIIEFSHTNSEIAILERRDGRRFTMENARLSANGNNNGWWWCDYEYRNPVTGSEQEKRIFDAGEDKGWKNVRRIVFGIQRPKMNPNNKRVYPPDYVYDPYDGTTLVPVKWTGATHRPE